MKLCLNCGKSVESKIYKQPIIDGYFCYEQCPICNSKMSRHWYIEVPGIVPIVEELDLTNILK